MCRSRKATPRQFVTLLNNWNDLYDNLCGSLNTDLGHLKAGLGKLEEAAETVDHLEKEAKIQQKELAVAQVAADQAMEQIAVALSQATERRREVEVLKEEIDRKQEDTLKQKMEIEEELSSITPILESAKVAVGGIKNDNLTEIRSLKMPPGPISDVLSAVLLLLGIQDTSWSTMRKFLGNRGVKEEILNFDARRITKEMRTLVSKLLKNKASSFEHANIYRVSVAAAPLAAWVKANIRYSLVLEKIEPLEDQLNEAKAALDAAQQRLDECEQELKEIDDKVSVLKASGPLSLGDRRACLPSSARGKVLVPFTRAACSSPGHRATGLL
jgi:dynein heavy chain 2